MKKRILLVTLSLISLFSFAQITTYLAKNTFPLGELERAFDKEFYNNQVFFFGFVHGSEVPQQVDLKLLRLLNQNGVSYYAPEVDQSLAYFLNQYLESGDEKLLKFIVYFYSLIVPQDASVQFKDKWRKIYQYNHNLPESNRIKVIGFDTPTSKELTLTHLAHIAPQDKTGNAIVDSLRYFTNFDLDELNIRSGKPIMKSGKSWDYYLGGEKTSHYNRLLAVYKKDPESILSLFGKHRKEVEMIFSSTKAKNREEFIFERFKTITVPLLKKGEKVYCNYGYYHIQQKEIDNRAPFAAMIKKSLPYRIVTLQGVLFDSECLNHIKLCFDKKIDLKGLELDKMNYCGYKTSKTLDGDSFFERINGHQLIRKSENDVEVVNLVASDSPFRKALWFADFSKGGKNWKTENGAVTTDYFQYLVVMKNSNSNIPYQEEK